MNEHEKLRRQAALYRLNYPPGTRVMLLNMTDPHAPVPPGTRGTVDLVDAIGSLHTTWDNGRSLALIPSEDTFRKLTQAELAEEQTESPEENEAPAMGLTM